MGEFFSAPAITLADQATLNMLGDENADLYGRQRMFGSLGWAVAMLVVGMALDSSTAFPGHPCLPHERERNYRVSPRPTQSILNQVLTMSIFYKVCFTIFAILMASALAIAYKFEFIYEGGAEGAMMGGEGHPSDIALNPFETSKPKPIFNTAPPVNAPSGQRPDERKFEFIDRWRSAVFAQRNRQMPEWMTVLKNFANLRYGAFLFVVWFMGLGIGLGELSPMYRALQSECH